MSSTDQQEGGGGSTSYVAIQATPEFAHLRRTFRAFVFPMTALFLVWYFLYVLLSTYAPDFMSHKVFGNITTGLLFGLGQFVSTFVDHDGLPQLGGPEVRPRGCRAGRPGAGPPRPRRGRPMSAAVQAADTPGSPGVNITIFAIFVAVTLLIVFRASRNNRSAADYYAAGRSFTGPQNGIAISGDYLSAASFLGIAGAIAINGYDGFLYSIGFLVAWLVALLLVAELLRNTGRFTMADVLSFRLRQQPIRMAAAISTLVVSFFYLLAQMAGAGGLVALLLGVEQQDRPGHRDRRRRRDHGAVRADRRHEGHHLGADRQGRPAGRRRRRDDHLGARQVRLQPVRPARRGRGEEPQGRRRSSARACSTARPRPPSSTSSRCRWPWCSAPPVCRTC